MITDEHRAELHKVLDRAINNAGPAVSVEVKYGTRSYPDESSGMMRTERTSSVTITITATQARVDRSHDKTG